MKITVESWDHNGEPKALIETHLENGGTLGDYSEHAEEFISIVNKEEALKLVGELVMILYLTKEEVAEAVLKYIVNESIKTKKDIPDVVSTYAEENNISRSEAFRKLYSQECIPSDKAERIKTKT